MREGATPLRAWNFPSSSGKGVFQQNRSEAVFDAVQLSGHEQAPLRIDALAREVNMSPSLHHQFKVVTGASPLQYQKALRLEEARRRLISDEADVTRIGLSVGYEGSSRSFETIRGSSVRRRGGTSIV